MLKTTKYVERKARWRDGAAARVVLPALALLGLGLVALFWVSRNVADDLDRQALEREERVISTLIKTKAHHWSKLALDYAYWDDAYAHLSKTPDREWMAGNFDQSVPESQGAEALILMRSDLEVEAWFGEARDDAALAASIGVKELVAAILANRKKGPRYVDGLITWKGQVALAGMARLMRQDGTADEALPPKLVLFVSLLGPKTVLEWSQSLEIQDMALLEMAPQSGPYLKIETRRGRALGTISWTSDAPGTKFLRSQLAMRTAIMIALVGALAVLVFAWASMMRRLSAGAAKSEALVEASRSKSAFLANMSHELRTPLNAIIGFSEMMKEEVFGPLGRPQYKDYAGHVHGSGKHLLQIINSLLDVAKFESGQFEQKPEPVTLRELAASAMAAHRTNLENGGLNVDLIGEGATAVMADLRSIARVFDAILSNAAKFTPRGGRVEIALLDGRNPSIQIRDTGCGIPPDKLEAMGRPFEQAADVLRRDHGGVGLGLAFSRMLMEGQGGALRLDSVVEHGTTVSLDFRPAPAARSKAA